MNTAIKNSPPNPLVSSPNASLKKSRNDWMFHVAMNRASIKPTKPLTTDAHRATTTSCESVVRRKRCQKSIEKAVATLLMLLEMVLIVAAKMAAIEAAAAREATQRGLTKEQILAANQQYQKLSATMSMLKAKAVDYETSCYRR